MLKIRRDDEVVAITGRDKGKRGKVTKVFPNKRILVTGINIKKKHQKPNPQMQQPGGIIEKESPIHVSNVVIWNNKTAKADRVGFKIDDDKKIRYFKSNGDLIA